MQNAHTNTPAPDVHIVVRDGKNWGCLCGHKVYVIPRQGVYCTKSYIRIAAPDPTATGHKYRWVPQYGKQTRMSWDPRNRQLIEDWETASQRTSNKRWRPVPNSAY